LKEKYKRHTKIYTDGSQKEEKERRSMGEANDKKEI
jgi:hypothetical protein